MNDDRMGKTMNISGAPDEANHIPGAGGHCAATGHCAEGRRAAGLGERAREHPRPGADQQQPGIASDLLVKPRSCFLGIPDFLDPLESRHPR